MRGGISNNKTFWTHFILALLTAALVITWQSMGKKPDARASDSHAYMSVAKELIDTGVFTDGSFRRRAAARGENGQGMFFTPLYPALVASVMAIDNTFYNTVSCHVSEVVPETCPHDFGAFRAVQIGLAIMSAFLVWLAGWVLTHRYTAAWLAMMLAMAAEVYAHYTAQIMTESLLFPLYTAFCLSAAAAWKCKKSSLWLAAGLLIGLAALTRPSFAYLFYAALPVIPILAVSSKNLPLRQTMKWPILFLAGYFLATGPWVLRNGLAMGEYKITKGYASFTLAQRVSYNDMSWKEWTASFVYGLPDFGDSLAKRLFPPQDYERFAYSHPDGFYATGVGKVTEETVKAAGGMENHLSYLLKHHVLGNIGKHVMVTLSLAWSGMWVSKYWSLITIPLFIGVFIFAVRRRWGEFLIFSIPAWFMLGLHAFTSVNVVRYNLILVPCLAVAAAFLLSLAISSIRGRIGKNKRLEEWQWASQ